MMISSHFGLDEFLSSQVASRQNFSEQFSPAQEVIDNLERLAGSLEVVRILLGSAPIIVTSGFRCVRLNTAIGGAADSAHLLGLAADFIAPKFGTSVDICRLITRTEKLEFDQVIYEYGSWCHFAIGPGSRRQSLSKFPADPTYYPGIILSPPPEKSQ